MNDPFPPCPPCGSARATCTAPYETVEVSRPDGTLLRVPFEVFAEAVALVGAG